MPFFISLYFLFVPRPLLVHLCVPLCITGSLSPTLFPNPSLYICLWFAVAPSSSIFIALSIALSLCLYQPLFMFLHLALSFSIVFSSLYLSHAPFSPPLSTLINSIPSLVSPSNSLSPYSTFSLLPLTWSLSLFPSFLPLLPFISLSLLPSSSPLLLLLFLSTLSPLIHSLSLSPYSSSSLSPPFSPLSLSLSLNPLSLLHILAISVTWVFVKCATMQNLLMNRRAGFHTWCINTVLPSSVVYGKIPWFDWLMVYSCI